MKKERCGEELAYCDDTPCVLVDVMAELVRHDKLRLVLGKGGDERIADDDAMRAADTGDERVRLSGLAAHIHSQNVGIADAKTRGEPAQSLLLTTRRRARTC